MTEQLLKPSKPEQKKAPKNLEEAIEASDLAAVKRFIADLQKKNPALYKGLLDRHLTSAIKIYGSAASSIVLALLEANASITICTPLSTAIAAGRIETTAILLDKKADIPVEYRGVISAPLHEAVRLGDVDIVALLLKKKAKIGSASIGYAARYGSIDMITTLIQHDPKTIELLDEEKNSPLIIALDERRYDIARTLIEAKADLRKTSAIHLTDQFWQRDRSRKRRTALELILEGHPLEIKRFSCLHPNVIQPTRDQLYNALYSAITALNRTTAVKVAEVSALLAAKTSVSYAPTGCLSPLELAKHLNAHQLIIDMIQKKGQKIALLGGLHRNLTSASTTSTTLFVPGQQTAETSNQLFNAIERLDQTAVKKLLDEKADPNQILKGPAFERLIINADLDRHNPPNLLTWVAQKSDIEALPIVLELLKADEANNVARIRGARAMRVDPGPSPCDVALAAAVKKGRTRVATALLEAKANPNKNIPPLNSRLAVASAMGDERTVEKLLEHKATIDKDAIHQAVENGHVNLVKTLLSGSAPTIIDECDLLNTAINYQQEVIAKILIDARADIEHISRHDHYHGHHTPLIHAANLGLISTVKVLLEAKANVNGVNEDGNTALHRVFSEGSNQSTNGQVVAILLDAKANPNFLNTHGESPLGCAVAQLRPQPSAVAALVAAKADIHHRSVVEQAKRRCPDNVVEAFLRPGLYAKVIMAFLFPNLNINPLLGMAASPTPDEKLSTTLSSARREGTQFNALATVQKRSAIFDQNTLRLVLRLANVTAPQPHKSEPKSEAEPEYGHRPSSSA